MAIVDEHVIANPYLIGVGRESLIDALTLLGELGIGINTGCQISMNVYILYGGFGHICTT